MFDRFLQSVVGGIGAARGAAIRVAPIFFGLALLVALLTLGARPVWATGRGGAHGTRASATTRSIETNLFRAYTRYVHALNLRGKIPAFARKYGLACSACHTAWPELNAFGQTFRDNGYQLMNDRDSPIWQNPAYIPVTFRVTPNWHLESATKQPVDSIPGVSGVAPRTVTQSGFDLSGMDLWTAGTIFKNISFVLLPSADINAQFHFESMFLRFDNMWHNRWVNFKVGKFELDNLISEKRFLFLSGNGGLYQAYHFLPAGDANDFGLGDNQIGAELSGHSENSYTRYGVAVLSTSSGTPGLVSGNAYDTYLTFSHAIDAGSLGVERLGAYAYLGRRPTYFQTSGGTPIPGTGAGNKPFYRIGLSGDFFFGNLEFLPFVMRASDDAYLATATPANAALPAGAKSATWNSGFLEAHYYVNHQLVFTGRYEAIRMSQQAVPATPKTLGNIDALSAGVRWYPIMFSRAGLSWHTEISSVQTVGSTFSAADKVRTTSVFSGLDFDF
jgi:hypothetical protein